MRTGAFGAPLTLPDFRRSLLGRAKVTLGWHGEEGLGPTVVKDRSGSCNRCSVRSGSTFAGVLMSSSALFAWMAGLIFLIQWMLPGLIWLPWYLQAAASDASHRDRQDLKLSEELDSPNSWLLLPSKQSSSSNEMDGSSPLTA